MAIDTEERTSKTTRTASGAVSGDTQKNNNKKLVTIILIVIGALIVLSILGAALMGFVFKKGTESLIDKATDGQVKVNTNKDGGEMTFEGENSRTNVKTGSSAELPKDFPKNDVPVYKNAKIVSTSDTTIDNATTYSVMLSTKDSVADVAKFYKDTFSSGGWKETYSMNANSNSSSASYINESKQLTTIVSASSEDGDDTTVTLMVRVGDIDA